MMKQKAPVLMVIVAFTVISMIGAVTIGATATAAAATNKAIPSNATNSKPVAGYDNPQGYFTAIRHVYNDPNLRVNVFCKPGVKTIATCQIYDSSSSNADLIGIEYIITPKDYNSLPANEKPNWYIIDKALATTVQGQFPQLNTQQINIVLQHLLGNYGKIVLTWNPLDNLPITAPEWRTYKIYS